MRTAYADRASLASAALCAGLFAAICLLGGCRLLDVDRSPGGHSPLLPAQASPDSFALEIIWLRFPMGDPALNDTMWQEIDEASLPASLRRELANNGFRVGVVGGTLPDALASALKLEAQPPADSTDAAVSDASDESAHQPDAQAALESLSEPTVHRRLLQLPRGRRAEIQASDVYDVMPLLVSEGRELGGDTYHAVQAIYALEVQPETDGTVRVELTPELHYGAPRLRWTSGEAGVLRQEPLREREVFEQMRIAARLAPGEMLVLTSLPEAASRLGYYFHTVDGTSGRQQKLVLVRLAQVPPSDTFDPAGQF